jgi:hypothetical protein
LYRLLKSKVFPSRDLLLPLDYHVTVRQNLADAHQFGVCGDHRRERSYEEGRIEGDNGKGMSKVRHQSDCLLTGGEGLNLGLFSAIANYLTLRMTEADALTLAKNVGASDDARRLAGQLKKLE